MKNLFRNFAERVAEAVGTPWAFFLALAVLVTWGATGPFFGFSEPWQLIVNSFTTIVTFLMVFIIQNTQTFGRSPQNRSSIVRAFRLDRKSPA